MKIAINALATKSGGSITYLENILPELSKLSPDDFYYIFLSKHQTDLEVEEKFENMKVIKVSFFDNLLFRFAYEQLILPLLIFFLKVDILYCPADIASFLAPCKVILAIRNPNPYSCLVGNIGKRTKFMLMKYLTKYSARKASNIIFVSNYYRDLVSKRLNIPLAKSKTIYHGINLQNFQNFDEHCLNKDFKQRIDSLDSFILTVSTIYQHKDLGTLVRAYNRLNDSVKNDFKLVIAGGKKADSTAYNRLTELIKELNLNDKVVLLGRVPYRFIPYLYHRSVLFVLPSRMETFGHPLLEAMASGVPIIASNATAIPEILGGAGVLFNAGDAAELANRIEEVLSNEDLMVALRARGHERVKSFSWEKCAAQLLMVLEESASS